MIDWRAFFSGWDGKERASQVITISCGQVRRFFPLIDNPCAFGPQDADPEVGLAPYLPGFAHIFPLHPMNSRGIPNSRKMQTGK